MPQNKVRRFKMCKECKKIKDRIRIKRYLFETVKSVSSYDYIRGFMLGQGGLLDEDKSNEVKHK